jgi:hypothetical protein
MARDVPNNSLLPQQRRAILEIVRAYGARNVKIFGSRARGEAGPGSDLDLLVDHKPNLYLLIAKIQSRPSIQATQHTESRRC